MLFVGLRRWGGDGSEKRIEKKKGRRKEEEKGQRITPPKKQTKKPHLTKGVKSTQETRDTTSETCLAYGNTIK